MYRAEKHVQEIRLDGIDKYTKRFLGLQRLSFFIAQFLPGLHSQYSGNYLFYPQSRLHRSQVCLLTLY